VASPAARARTSRRDTAETTALWLLIHRWDDVAPCLHACLFVDEVHLEAFRLLAAHESFRGALDAAHGEVRDLLERLAVEDKRLEDPEGEAVRLVGEVARRAVADGLHEGDPEVLALVAWVRQQEEALTSTTTRREAAGQLLRWLASRVDEEGP
jgi:hypothetical protein